MEKPVSPDEEPMFADDPDKLSLELHRLVNAACDDLLTEDQAVRLNELLDRDATLRTQYLRQISLHTALTATAGHQAFWGTDRLQPPVAPLAAPPVSLPRWRRWSVGGSSPLVRAAAIIFLLVAGAVYVLDARLGRQNAPVLRAARSTGQMLVHDRQSSDTVADSQESQQVRVTQISPDARWQDPNDRLTVDASISVGNTVALAQGELELVYDTGVRLLLLGPTEFVMHEGGGELRRGGLMASVPEAGHGFTIQTPNGKVVDLGTEFGVVVDDFGVSEVSVFKGKVEAFPNPSQVSQDQKFELTKGRALQWSSQMLRTLEADPRRLSVGLASLGLSGGLESTVGEAYGDHSARSLPPEEWMALGDVSSTPTGLVLSSRSEPTRRPYLLSADEYDPSNGPVTVVCDIRFPELTPADDPSFAILTRSENERSTIDRPWSDILATCVRCNYRAPSGNAEGLLETATKFERDRELTGISWRGFHRPQENTLYRLVMRDDGVNVSLTVSEVNNPAATKTVVCRSIFRGYQNHVALEGWAGGTVIVEDVRILQPQMAPSANRLLARFDSSTREDADLSSPAEADNLLLEMVPQPARLVLQEGFDTPVLNPEHWKTLGDVVIENGAVSLGQLLRPQHIDTFHPRPYLLTRQEFTPGQGKVFVLGRIEFDENYLQGYGGSFAVLSRCDGQYGTGPEWAVSALGMGVRCNLWPASPRRDHMLEIHEKSAPNTLTFLRGASLNIELDSRTYDFCLEDDGQRAAITFQDVSNPAIHKTIAFDATTQQLKSGLIAFESCWGSRVLLDDVKIFVLESPVDPAE